MCLTEYITNAKEFKTFELANQAESSKALWVDSLSDSHVEIHPQTLNKDIFIDEVSKLVDNIKGCMIIFENKKIIINRKRKNVLYAIIKV